LLVQNTDGLVILANNGHLRLSRFDPQNDAAACSESRNVLLCRTKQETRLPVHPRKVFAFVSVGVRDFSDRASIRRSLILLPFLSPRATCCCRVPSSSGSQFGLGRVGDREKVQEPVNHFNHSSSPTPGRSSPPRRLLFALAGRLSNH